MLAKLAQAARLDGVGGIAAGNGGDSSGLRPGFSDCHAGIRGGAASSGPDDQQRTLTPAKPWRLGARISLWEGPITGRRTLRPPLPRS
jgi:hypothetical protein